MCSGAGHKEAKETASPQGALSRLERGSKTEIKIDHKPCPGGELMKATSQSWCLPGSLNLVEGGEQPSGGGDV